VLLLVLPAMSASASAQSPPTALPAPPAAPAAFAQLARDIFEELIEIDTTDTPSGDVTRAAEAMAARLRAAGFPAADAQVLGPDSKKGNLVARLRGTGGRRPLLLLGHLDVVPARREDWSVDPFTFLERDGYFYGRGTTDDKAMSAILVTNLIRYRTEGFTPARDLIVALTADEEGGNHNGVQWLLRSHRPLIDAELALNEGGDGAIRHGRRLLNQVQTSEKVYLSFRLRVTNSGGHSSLPTRENAIYRLAAALTRIAAFEFPPRLTETTRAFFARMAELESGKTADDMRAVAAAPMDEKAAARLSAASPHHNALLRTTCVATRVSAGHADNALPQSADALVNCRLLPGDRPEQVRARLARTIADDLIVLTPDDEAIPSDPSPLNRAVIEPIERITSEMWPGVPVVPTMHTGATDGLYLRNAGIPTYGVSGLFGDMDDERAHGRDERIGVSAFFEGQEFLYRLIKALSEP
jgi:acetylornithine deacetylase/succinyl-diaminopimelate desuccinylase-like protein